MGEPQSGVGTASSPPLYQTTLSTGTIELRPPLSDPIQCLGIEIDRPLQTLQVVLEFTESPYRRATFRFPSIG
ncbi:MAG: hypothetical protein C5B50_16490 [Verrucomicrobia bacterium]|nr:MAG: hypothetical protein C5B50_16490 [Verrucomicrobiota bacterium]